MKKYFDSFYEIIHKNNVKRRRMVSLLLVLSVFVSSGVLWELRDTVITMVNEPVCGFEEHNHTDECYEKVLICGAEESEEHTHTDECYEKVLICGYEEHLHTDLCYFEKDEIPEDNGQSSDDDVFEISNILIDGDQESEEELLALDMPKLTLDSGLRILDAETQNNPYINPGTQTTIDNIAEGIKFTLFDYGDSNLESKNNNYGFSRTQVGEDWVVDGPPYKHNNVKNTGINTGRNINDDIMFFAYGTPIPNGIPASNDYVFYNYTEDGTHYYNPDKNSYSGDYNSDPQYTGNRPVTGIVQSVLGSDGYPKMNNAEGNSLAYLFSPSTNVDGVDQSAYKTVYQNVNHLLQESTTGHLFYNSDHNYAYFDTDSRNFTVYDRTYPVINKDHHIDGDYDSVKETTYEGDNGGVFQIGFFPFDEYDPNRRDPNYDGNGYNHHFGMTMEATFTNLIDSNVQSPEPIVFKYSGDDDMWVFVDDVLVLDIGGIHEPAAGMIDFTNDLVWTQDNGRGKTAAEAYAELRSKTNNSSLPGYSTILVPDNGVNTDGEEESKWIVETISSKFKNIDGKSLGPNDGKNHTIKMFYLERGGCYSNLAMEMNLPTLKPLTVMKNVDYQDHLVKGLYEDYEYAFQLYELKKNETTNENEWIIPDEIPENSFKLKAGQRKTFENLGQTRVFKVVEVGYYPPGENSPMIPLDPDVFSKVSINNNEIPISGGMASTEGSPLKDFNSYVFTNQIKQETIDITIKKSWSGNVPTGYDQVKFRIMRTDTTTGEVKQVALVGQETDPESGQLVPVKRRTFSISTDEWANGITKTGLLSQYGDHYYTYSVEELNVPTGFKASYSVDGTGALVITNTDMSKTDLYVKKKWENSDGQDMKVRLKLTRSKIGYSESAKTDLQVKILDEGGNVIKNFVTGDVYVGGSAELAYILPTGVELYNGDKDYPRKTYGGTTKKLSEENSIDGKLYVNFDEENNILIVQNMVEGTNIVEFKVTSYNADDSLLLLHHSFTRGTNGWKTNTLSPKYIDNEIEKEKVTPSVNSAYAKGDGLIVQGREKAWNGAKLNLDPALFIANQTYTFSVYIKSPERDSFKMTFNNGLGQNEPLKLLGSNEQFLSVDADKWTQLTGTIKLTDNVDPYNMYLLIETIPVDNDYEASVLRGGTYFRMDEFTAIRGTIPVSVDEDSGVVRIGSNVDSNTVYYTDFSQGTDEWSIQDFGPEPKSQYSVEYDNKNDFYYVVITGRDATNDGIKMSVPYLEKGHTYKFEAQVQGNNDANARDIQLSLHSYDSNDHYDVLGTADISPSNNNNNNYAQKTITFNSKNNPFTVPENTDMSKMYIYFETPYVETENAQKGSFRVNWVKITEIKENVVIPGGYTIENGQYVSDYSNYNISLDTNSVTTPLKLDADGYKPDTGFEKVVELSAPWEYHWQNHDIATDDEHYLLEDNANNLYKYHIDEIAIIYPNGTEKLVDTNNSTSDLMSKDENYLVTYSGNDVASNLQASPILVTNEYIWYKLPATGGHGTGRIYFLGGIFTAIGIISGSALYRRKRRRV